MDLLIAREPSVDGVTLGHLFIEGKFCGFTLEDQIRAGPKVIHETAIPEGRYSVTITPSARFKRRLPVVQDVPGFSGVRIHAGNTKEDTSGCILVGLAQDGLRLEHSRQALDVVQQCIAQALAHGEEVWLTIQNPLPDVNA